MAARFAGAGLMRKIAIVGPESSGKTTLAQDLAQRLACPWVAEYVREYFATRADASYDLPDIIEIARGQLAAEHAAPASTDLVCDTNGLVCKIWAEVRFGVCHPNSPRCGPLPITRCTCWCVPISLGKPTPCAKTRPTVTGCLACTRRRWRQLACRGSALAAPAPRASMRC